MTQSISTPTKSDLPVAKSYANWSNEDIRKFHLEKGTLQLLTSAHGAPSDSIGDGFRAAYWIGWSNDAYDAATAYLNSNQIPHQILFDRSRVPSYIVLCDNDFLCSPEPESGNSLEGKVLPFHNPHHHADGTEDHHLCRNCNILKNAEFFPEHYSVAEILSCLPDNILREYLARKHYVTAPDAEKSQAMSAQSYRDCIQHEIHLLITVDAFIEDAFDCDA